MKKVWYIFKEMLHLIRAHKVYFIAPILLMLVLLTLLAFYLGPTAVLTFIYAGL